MKTGEHPGTGRYRRRIRKIEAALQRREMKIEMQKRRLAVQGEAPLIGIGDEGQARARQHMRRARHRVEWRPLDLFDRQSKAARGEVLQQSGVSRAAR